MKLNAKHRIEVVGPGSQPHKRRRRCWIFHVWGPWGPAYEVEMVMHRTLFNFEMKGWPFTQHLQDRTCRRCGYISARRIQ
jgi:hypothetical protein